MILTQPRALDFCPGLTELYLACRYLRAPTIFAELAVAGSTPVSLFLIFAMATTISLSRGNKHLLTQFLAYLSSEHHSHEVFFGAKVDNSYLNAVVTTQEEKLMYVIDFPPHPPFEEMYEIQLPTSDEAIQQTTMFKRSAKQKLVSMSGAADSVNETCIDFGLDGIVLVTSTKPRKLSKRLRCLLFYEIVTRTSKHRLSATEIRDGDIYSEALYTSVDPYSSKVVIDERIMTEVLK